jgi:hypothetical protein
METGEQREALAVSLLTYIAESCLFNSNMSKKTTNESEAEKPAFSRSELMKRLWADPEWRAKQLEKSHAHSARMAEKWRDPEWAEKTKKTMGASRKTERIRNKMRDALMDAARRQARASGVAPIWTPKKVASIEPTGRSFQHQSVRACAAHYGITESNMRALLKFSRDWNGIKFITVE